MELNYDSLKTHYHDVKDQMKESQRIRIHRTLSWYKCALESAEDDASAFIFYWIAFNAIYAQKYDYNQKIIEHKKFEEFFEKILRHDKDKIIYKAIWEEFSESIRIILQNKYVFNEFWHFQNGVEGFENWEKKFKKNQISVNHYLQTDQTQKILSMLFNRLYVLRNQLIHGGATWQSSINKDQLRDGHKILGFLLPHFILILIENRSENWGAPIYPVIHD